MTSHANPRGTGPLPPAEPAALASLVEYAAGSVVSRALYKGPGGTLTLFAFDAEQELSEHTAPFDAFVHVLDGAVELSIGGEPVQTRAGEIVLMPKHVPHAVRASERFKMLLVMMKG